MERFFRVLLSLLVFQLEGVVILTPPPQTTTTTNSAQVAENGLGYWPCPLSPLPIRPGSLLDSVNGASLKQQRRLAPHFGVACLLADLAR